MTLTQDARNRALRTFLQGLAASVLLAVCLVLYNAFTDANGWGDFDWSALGFLLVQTVVTTAGSFIMRRYLDASAVPTPLPPTDYPQVPGDPAI